MVEIVKENKINHHHHLSSLIFSHLSSLTLACLSAEQLNTKKKREKLD